MYIERLTSLRKSMEEKGVDGVLLIGDYNRNYMSGFTGDESFSLITKDKAFFIVDSRFTEQAKKQVKDYEVLQYKGHIEDFLGNLVNGLKIKNLGFEEDIISYKNYMLYKSKMSANMIPLDGMVEKLRLVKDDIEVQCIRNAAKIADDAFDHILGFIKPEMTENEISLELEYFMKSKGAQGLSFPSIAASGMRGALPHGAPTQKKVKMGEFITMDYGCILNGYCSDMTRTVAVGKPDDKMVEIYNIVLEAQLKVLDEIKEGKVCFDVDKVARDHIKSKGYGDYFGHGLGHGVGREIHEAPYLNTRDKTVLKSKMIVTDEPGIYLSGKFGVRIEDLVLVKKDGCEALSKSPKNLITL